MFFQSFPKDNDKNKNSSGTYEEKLVLFIIPLHFVPITLKQITETDKEAVPEGNPEKGIGKKLGVWLLDAAGNEGNIGAA